MGNHDQRDNCWNALPADDRRAREVADRQVLVLNTPRANWIILDSLDQTNSIPGLLGAAQLKWLGRTLDAHPSKPTIIMVHHNPYFILAPAPATQPAAAESPPENLGLLDIDALLGVLLPRKQVKALLYGHIHAWHVEKLEGMHMINLPATSYVFDADQPSAWVDACLGEKGITLELRCLDHNHPWNGEKHELAWRT